MLHVKMRLKLKGFTMILWAKLFLVSLTNKEKCKAQNVSASCFRCCYFVNDCERYAGYDNLTQ